MRYLCLVYHEQAKLDALPKQEYAQIIGKAQDYAAELTMSGYVITSAFLHHTDMATTIRVHHGKITLSDDPPVAPTERLGGFYLIEARDLNDAIRVAGKLPLAHLGWIEIHSLGMIQPQR